MMSELSLGFRFVCYKRDDSSDADSTKSSKVKMEEIEP